MRFLTIIGSLLTLSVVGCATTPPPDYTQFKAHRPISILVLPPINNSVEVDAPHTYLSVITRPIAERGFYVFPVTLVEHYFQNNGLTEPVDIHQVPLKKFQEVFGADAVFYVTIEEWGNKFQLVSSTTKVRAEGVLVDARSGIELWRGEQVAQLSSGASQGGLGEILVGAVLHQIANELTDATRDLARRSSYETIFGPRGFIEGPLLSKKTEN